MPTRQGHAGRRRRNREHSDRESDLKHKKDKIPQNDYWKDEMDRPVDDDDDPNDDNCGDYDFSSSSETKPIGNKNSKRNRHTRAAAFQSQSGDVENELPTVIEISHGRSEQRFLDNRQLPPGIYEIFSGMTPVTEVISILERIQEEEELFNGAVAARSKSLVEHLKQVLFQNFDEQVKKQVRIYVKESILKQSSYGILLYNTKGEILIIRNDDECWNAPVTHRKINVNYHQLETIKETASRIFNEGIRVTNQTTQQIYNLYDIDREQRLDSSKYIEYEFTPVQRTNDARRVGLFIIGIDESRLTFDRQNAEANRNCQWVKLDKVLDHESEDYVDIDYTLTPFAEKLQSMLMFNGNIPTK